MLTGARLTLTGLLILMSSSLFFFFFFFLLLLSSVRIMQCLTSLENLLEPLVLDMRAFLQEVAFSIVMQVFRESLTEFHYSIPSNPRIRESWELILGQLINFKAQPSHELVYVFVCVIFFVGLRKAKTVSAEKRDGLNLKEASTPRFSREHSQ